MIGSLPPKPDGSTRFVRWAQWVQESILALRPMESHGLALQRTTRGFAYIPKRAKPGGGGGINWRGEWSKDTIYVIGDLVRVSVAINASSDPNNYTGVWLCVLGTAPGDIPVYPEPDGAKWVLISLGVREINVADNVFGVAKMLVASNDPYQPVTQ